MKYSLKDKIKFLDDQGLVKTGIVTHQECDNAINNLVLVYCQVKTINGFIEIVEGDIIGLVGSKESKEFIFEQISVNNFLYKEDERCRFKNQNEYKETNTI